MRRGRQPARAGRGGRIPAGAVTRLGKRFARFRSEHPRGTRYPDKLRQAVLGLLGEVEPDAVYRACGLSFGQVMAWKDARRVAPAQALEAEAAKVRVFSVVDEQPALGFDPQAPAPDFELRLGPWSVSVRLARRRPSGRGRACCP